MKRNWEDKVNRSTVTLAALVLLLGVLLTVRALLPQQAQPVAQIGQQSEAAQAGSDGVTEDFFRDFRLQREQARADEIALLDDVINREGAPEESVREADARRVELTRAMEQERMLEKLLVAKGFEDAAVFVMPDSATVAVKKAELEEQDTAKILELALRCTGMDAGKIKIVPVAP